MNDTITPPNEQSVDGGNEAEDHTARSVEDNKVACNFKSMDGKEVSLPTTLKSEADKQDGMIRNFDVAECTNSAEDRTKTGFMDPVKDKKRRNHESDKSREHTPYDGIVLQLYPRK